MIKNLLFSVTLGVLALSVEVQDLLKLGGTRFIHITGSQNLFIGNTTGSAIATSSSHNLFIGQGSGPLNSVGNFNTFLGANTGYKNTSGAYNSFLGSLAGESTSTGGENTFVGMQAGYFNVAGGSNTFVGRNAGVSNISGNSNTTIGYLADLAGANKANLTNATAIGARAKVTISDAIVLGDTTNTNIKVGIGTAAPRYPLDVKGNINIRRGPGGAGKLIFASRSSISTDEQEYIVLSGGKEGESGLRLANLTKEAIPIGVANQFLSVDASGRVGVYRAALPASMVRLQVTNPTDWADYVFKADYPLRSIQQLDDYLKQHKHLPNIPSAETMTNQGASVEELVKGLVKNQEEQARYLVQLQAENERLKQENAEIKTLVKSLVEKIK